MVRVFKYNEDTEPILVTEQEIRANYWPYWYKEMCAKHGKELVDSKFTFDDCIYAWIIENWAWEVK